MLIKKNVEKRKRDKELNRRNRVEVKGREGADGGVCGGGKRGKWKRGR